MAHERRGAGAARALLVACACARGASTPPATPSSAPPPCNSVASCEDACRATPGPPCVRYAFIGASDPDLMASDELHALLGAACDAGTMRACSLLAVSLCEPDEGGWSACEPRAMELFRRACEAGDGYGCDGVGFAYEGRVQGVPIDEARAAEFHRRSDDAFEASCGPGAPTDCLEAATRLGGRDAARAEELARQGLAGSRTACERDPRDAVACVALANWYEATLDGRAVAYWKRACDLGVTSVCR